jgi:exosome complex component RRP4
VDIKAPYPAPLHATESPWDVEFGDTARFLNVGDVLLCHVLSVDEIMRIQLTMRDREARRVHGGQLLEIQPSKVPRVIGREGSMIGMIKQASRSGIYVGQNGRIWLDGRDEDIALATRAIKLVEEHAQAAGLTEIVKDFLSGAGRAGAERR